jgi:sarcosine oxidase
MPSDRRCVVVGAGLLGLSAAWSLSRRGWSVEVLEAGGAVGHQLAGSKGDARIFRLGYQEPHYVEMAVAARTAWRELEALAARPLLHVTGQVSFGDPAALDAIADALARHGDPVERLHASEIAARVPGFALPAGSSALLEPSSGVLVADACLEALCATAAFEMHTNAPVASIESTADGAIGRGADGRAWPADVVIDCAGPHALALLGDAGPLAVGAPPSLPQVAYFRADASAGAHDPGAAQPPVFIEWGDAMVYGLPVFGPGPHAGTYKVSHHTPGPALDVGAPDATWATALASDDLAHLAVLSDAVRRLLPGLDPVPVVTERCVYDNSVDGDFVLDRVGNVVVGCGTSGHAFKFGPLLGELLADLADGSRPRIDLHPFRLERPRPSDRTRPPSR